MKGKKMANKLHGITVVIGIIFLVSSFLFLPACGEEQGAVSTESKPAPENETGTIAQLETYTIADSIGDWGFPSPYAHYSRGPGYVRMHYIFETLVWKNATEFIPQLATEWEYDEEANAYTFKLQKNVKWHDGVEFTADDVAFTYNYAEEHPYQWVDNSIVESVEVLDKYTVKIYLSKTYAPFFQDVAGAQPILPKHIWENVTVPEEFQSEESTIGTGPCKLGDYSKEHGTYLYVANDDYYLGKPVVKEIRFVKIASEMNPAALKDGSVDSASVPAEVIDDIKASGFTVIECPPSWNAKLTINHQKEPLSDKKFRQAIAYAINRESLVEIVLRGEGIPGSPGLMPPTSVWFNPDTPQYEYNPDKAKELIEGLGYSMDGDYFTKNGQRLKLSLIAAADYKDLGQFITEQLEDIGIDIDFQTYEAKTVDSKVEAWDFDLSIYGHGGIYDPSILKRTIIDDGFNSSRYTSNAELTELLQNQLTEMNPEKRKEMVFRIQELYAEDVPALTLYYPRSYWAHDGSINLYYTMDGLAIGVPIPLNRMCFVK
jgi:peptide/nickel transport system substrate-binding protein